MNIMLRPAQPKNADHDYPLHTLYAKVKGRIVRQDDTDYDGTRALALSNWDYRPALIVRVADAGDVAAAIEYARACDLELAIRSGGHSVCGHGSTAGGIVVDTRDLNTLEIADDRSSLWAGAGLTAGQVTTAIEKQQLIIGFGDAATVGISGITLGGGVGYLVRKHGLTIDSLLAVELVTADGEILVADENNHPDLFWALRGGGGNFGVATRFKYRLHSLPEFIGGPLILPATPEVLCGFVEAARAAPDELSTILQAMPAPPLPFLPPHVVGQNVIMGMMAFAGPLEEAQKALAPFRALAEPLADLVGPMPLSGLYLPEEEGPAPAVAVRTLFMDRLDLQQGAQLLDLLAEGEAPMRMVQIRILGGAAARVPVGDTAYAHRNREIMTTFLAMSEPAMLARNEAWGDRCQKAADQGVGGVYVNFLTDDLEYRIRDAYPGETWKRLRQVKRRYDPANVFRLNHNVPPAELDA